MNQYEIALVVSAQLTDEDRAAVVEQVKNYIVKYEGTIVEVEEWGKRRLAYEIRKQNEGYYYFIKAQSNPTMPVELEKNLRIMMETVLRYLIVREGE